MLPVTVQVCSSDCQGTCWGSGWRPGLLFHVQGGGAHLVLNDPFRVRPITGLFAQTIQSSLLGSSFKALFDCLVSRRSLLQSASPRTAP